MAFLCGGQRYISMYISPHNAMRPCVCVRARAVCGRVRVCVCACVRVCVCACVRIRPPQPHTKPSEEENVAQSASTHTRTHTRCLGFGRCMFKSVGVCVRVREKQQASSAVVCWHARALVCVPHPSGWHTPAGLATGIMLDVTVTVLSPEHFCCDFGFLGQS